MAYRLLGLTLLLAASVAACAADGSSDPFTGEGGRGGDVGIGGAGGIGAGGSAGTGGTSVPECTTSVLCQSCPSDALCESQGDCADGFACIESGCEDLAGGPIRQCVFAGGGACGSDAICTPIGRVCREVEGEGKRCVKLTPGCDTSFDCVTGFVCEDGSCVDRRVPCELLDEHCPMNHVCVSSGASSFCSRIHVDCSAAFDCVDLAGSCADIDGDGRSECAGTFNPNDNLSEACTNDFCDGADAPVCEASGAGSTSQCGQYGLCFGGGCAEGFTCVALWPDGRSECVREGGRCSSYADCPAREVCASPREGGAPSCQAGFQP